jgi:homoserine dehydrogenase
MHVVTSNKGPAAFAKSELWQLAEDNGVQFRFEGAVMSGTPVISLVTSSLAGAEISGFRGILNGTCNHILTRMEDGVSYETALREAQDMGFTEANPTIDVDGWDATAKGVILANTLMGANLALNDVPRKGITNIGESEISKAKGENKRWRLVVECEKENGDVKLTVSPQKLELTDSLSNVMGTKNALTVYTDVMGDITIHGRGAGRQETGFAILSDLLWIHRRITGKAY